MELKKDKMKCQMEEETELTVKKNWQRQISARGQGPETNRHRRREKSTKQQTYRSETGVHMMGRGRTHHHVAKQKKRGSFEKSHHRHGLLFHENEVCCECSNNLRRIDILHCGDRVCVEKKGVEEPWTIERVAKFIDLLGHREITLKSDTEPAIIAFRKRVAENVLSRGHHKGRGEGNGLIENAVMLLRGIIRTIKCQIESRQSKSL